MRRHFACTVFALMSILTLDILQPPATLAQQLDWPHWRGPEMNGISREKNIVAEWDPEAEEGGNVLWVREDLGSISTPVVLNDKLYTICRDQPGTIKEGEKVVCVDTETGETVWENRFNVFLSDVPAERVGWSSVVADPSTGKIYALGVCGYFQCLDGTTGETLWSHSLSEEYGLLSTYGGRTNVPLIHDSNVIISAVVIGWGEMAKPAHRFIAFDKRNGQPVWFEGTRLLPDDTTYSSPVLSVLSGEAAMVFGSGDGGVHAFQPRTGKSLLTYNVSQRGINTTPLVVDNVIYCGHSEENIDTSKMGALFAIDGTKRGVIGEDGVLWRKTEWFVGKSSPILVDGRLYAIEDKANMLIVNPENGELIKKQKMGTMQRSSPLYVDGKIYTCTANGRWYTFKPTEDGVETLYKMRISGGSYGSPIVSNGQLYVPTTEALYCIGHMTDSVEPPTADPVPPKAPETPKEADPVPAQVQVVPVESLLRPGYKQNYHARLYNQAGQYLGLAAADEVTFTVEGIGSIDAEGVYSSGNDEGTHADATITATVGPLTGTARVRVVPDLNWSFNFDDGVVPVTWVGASYRNVVIDWDLFQELKASNPKVAQLYIYMITNYTNFNPKIAVFDDSTPRATWTDLLIFMQWNDAETRPKNVEAAKGMFDPLLTALQEKQVVADWTWETWSKELDGGVTLSGPKLTVNKGERSEISNGVLTKITTIPKGTRSQAWMGHADLGNYTIQADVLGATKNGKVPDIGLIGQRYTLDMMGASQQLQIRTWPPQLRMAQTIPFEWQPNVWYTMKLRTAVENGKAVLRGKVWPRDAEEPAEWLLTATDESPNEVGSPGLFGNAKDAEVFYDNISVTANTDDLSASSAPETTEAKPDADSEKPADTEKSADTQKPAEETKPESEAENTPTPTSPKAESSEPETSEPESSQPESAESETNPSDE